MYPTPYSDVNAIIQAVLADAQAILGDQMVGMYLHGSLATGDFDPHTSDIDFVIVTTGDLDAETVAALAAMHARSRTEASHWATHYEGDYVPLYALQTVDLSKSLRPHLGIESPLRMEGYGGGDVIQRFVLREHEVIVSGPSLREQIAPVSPDELRQATLAILRGWWVGILHDPALLYEPLYQPYAVLSMCRILYTVEHGAVVSKPTAARWAAEQLEDQWAGLINLAMTSPDLPPDTMPQTLDFIRFTLDHTKDV